MREDRLDFLTPIVHLTGKFRLQPRILKGYFRGKQRNFYRFKLIDESKFTDNNKGCKEIEVEPSKAPYGWYLRGDHDSFTLHVIGNKKEYLALTKKRPN